VVKNSGGKLRKGKNLSPCEKKDLKGEGKSPVYQEGGIRETTQFSKKAIESKGGEGGKIGKKKKKDTSGPSGFYRGYVERRGGGLGERAPRETNEGEVSFHNGGGRKKMKRKVRLV